MMVAPYSNAFPARSAAAQRRKITQDPAHAVVG